MITVWVPGPPGDLAINRKAAMRGRGSRKWIGKSQGYTAAQNDARMFTLAEVGKRRWRKTTSGPIWVVVHTVWPRRHRTDGLDGYPLGDVDATVKGVLDALKHAGVYDDDARVLGSFLTKSGVGDILHEPGIVVSAGGLAEALEANKKVADTLANIYTP